MPEVKFISDFDNFETWALIPTVWLNFFYRGHLIRIMFLWLWFDIGVQIFIAKGDKANG